MSEPRRFKPGITWRSVLGIFYAAVIFLPVTTFLLLVAGTTVAAAASYMTAILFSELFRLFGSPLTKQELYIIYEMSGIAATMAVFLEMVYKGYFIHSPAAWSVTINGRPLPELIPSWWVPPLNSEVYVLRTLFHRDWVIPVALAIFQFGILYLLQEFALTLIMSMLCIEVQKLEFPWAQVDAQMVITLSERDEERMHFFMLSAVVGFVVALLIYGPLFIIGRPLVPLPWLDLTYFTDKYIPGAAIGIPTDPAAWAMGLVLPLNHVLYIFIGSFAIWVFGNHLALTVFADKFPEWVNDYMVNMGIGAIYERSLLDIWIAPMIGFSLALAVFLIAISARYLKSALSALARLSEAHRQAGYPPLWVLLLMYLAGTLGSVAVFYVLAGEGVPLWLPIVMSVGFSFAYALIGSQAMGHAGYPIYINYPWQTALLAVGYHGVNAWLFYPNIGGALCQDWVNRIKAAYLTETRPIDFIKAFCITFVAYHIFSYIYTDAFWRMAPMPSSTYPYLQVLWPARAVMDATFISGKIAVALNRLVYSFAGMLGVLVAGSAISRLTGLPFSPVGLIVGTTVLPPFALALLVGSAAGRYIMPKAFGRKRWERLRAVIVAGFLAGEALVIGVGVAGAIIRRAVWALPY